MLKVSGALLFDLILGMSIYSPYTSSMLPFLIAATY